MSKPTQIILGVYALAIGSWLLMFAFSLVAGGLPLLLVPFLILGPPVLFLVLAYALVRATRDLLREPEFRTFTNIGVAFAGLVGLVLAAWSWYSSVSQHNAAL